MKKARLVRLLALTLAVCLLPLGGCARRAPEASTQPSQAVEATRRPEPAALPLQTREGDVSLSYRAGEDYLQIYTQQGWEDIYLKGVDIGAGKPGYFPGELGITYADYLRWFHHIGDMGANVIRVYTILMPEFYEALYDYNTTAEKPLYFFQGVYNDESLLAEYGDVFAHGQAVYWNFVSDIQDCVDVVHGNVELAQNTGHAYGTYHCDVSPWQLGWLIGIEFDADTIDRTNKGSPEKTAYKGEYISVADASAFEVFLAMSMDHTTKYETERYQVQRPIAFCSWPTSDPLDHPDEGDQDMENGPGFDEAKLVVEDKMKAGIFVSYHVYPYYPDYLVYSDMYRKDDPQHAYRTYLQTLKEHYGKLPFIITELGVPTARGMAHRDENRDFDQGNHNEQEQGEILVALLEDVKAAGCGGGIIFTWQDEWFKRTWNTMDYDNAERRAYWSNIQTAEQNFGVLAFDPGRDKSVVTLDGDPTEWAAIERLVTYKDLEVKATSDERYLYLLINTDQDFELGFDIHPDVGNDTYNGIALGAGTDFYLRRTGDTAELLICPYYYTTGFTYGYFERKGFRIETEPTWFEPNSGLFVPIDMMLNRSIVIGNGTRLPGSLHRAGDLVEGNGDPESPEFNSLADYCVGDGVTEIRLPWFLLNFSDPSTGEIVDNMYADPEASNEQIPFRTVEDIGVGLFDAQGNSWGRYTLKNWDMPTYHERLKQSYYIVREYWKSQG